MRRAFGLRILNANHKDIRRLKREGNQAVLHGHKFWNSSFLIMDYLKKNPLKRNTRVLEIGCGWGLLGIYCAKTFACKVDGIDADKNVLPFLQLHAELNDVSIRTENKTFQRLTTDYLSQYDLVLGADICYWDEMTGILANLIARSRRAGVKQVIIADPCRPPFTDLAERCMDRYDQVKVKRKFLSKPVKASGDILVVN
ncbi:MAG: SAM-dependent methyltransferase [Gammaproteobacteria bacterium]|jgi:predicted nicotinamide N-methyase|nr:SAM-dependent methyltransferase [Gammaproteobacteria bacterium]|tara:strand:+ start:1469 stop:2065 length:597 start_codon:yes stop_codon:yes gene_type:complete